jgi:DNA-binding response OmpR family regulator
MKKSILVVDDDPVVLKLLQHLVENAGYQFVGASKVSEAQRLAERRPPDAAIVDLNLGDENGLDLVRLWRVERSFPVLILSARCEAMDRVVGLEVGADDFIAKPFEPRELQLRLRNALERFGGHQRIRAGPATWTIGRGIFDVALRAIRVGERQIPLTTAEFRLVDLLVRHPNQVLTRDRIMDSVHHRERHFATDRSVDMLIARLRRKTDEAYISIQAIRGAGYMLCSSVERLA